MTPPDSTPHRAVRRRLSWIVAGLLVIAALGWPLYRANTSAGAGGRVGASEWMMGDFLSVVYYPAVAFADGVNPYDAAQYLGRYPAPEPFRAYPPALLLVAQPFAWLSPATAVRTQVAITVALTVVLAAWALALTGVGVSALGVTVLTGIILLSRPGHWNLLQGQITVPVVLATYAALTLPRARVPMGALALAVALLKPSFGLPLTFLMLAAGRARAVLAGIALTALLNLPVFGVLSERSGGVIRAARLMFEGGMPEASERFSQYAIFRIDASALLSRLVGHSLGLVLPVLIGVGVLGGAAVLIRRRLREVEEDPMDLVSAVLASTAILLCVYHNGYDLLLLAWPATAIVVGFVRQDGERTLRSWLELGLIVVLAANYLASYTALHFIGYDSSIGLLAVSLNGVALLGLLSLYAGDALRGTGTWSSPPRRRSNGLPAHPTRPVALSPQSA